MRDLSIVVCTKNSESLIENCLREIKRQVPESELIIIDADSLDNTVEIARKYADKIIYDNGRGLSCARQLGIDNAKNSFVAFISPDNLVSRETLMDLMAVLKNNSKTAGVQPLTLIKKPKNYWERATKYIFDFLLNIPGPAEVLGTPCIFKKSIISRIRYDSRIRHGCDDTDLSLRIRKAGFLLERVNTFSEEEQHLNFRGFFSRWQFYGQGDAQFYRKYYKSWSFQRRLKSILHPFRKYILKGFWVAIKKKKPTLIPALIVATFARYYGWVRGEK